MTIKETIEQQERATLSPTAALSAKTKGRARAEPPCPIRTEYQRDKDRILHSKSFRRLKRKTQVFLSPDNDHCRTRLTHTLEVCQIARTIGRGKGLNEDLIEAISLGHDLGHTPYGHAGEDVLNKLLSTGFRHNHQSVRVVTILEKEYGIGLNLTHEVIDGILNHKTGTNPETLEGKVVQISDKIAYLNHDIEDAISANFLSLEEIPKEIIQYLGKTKSQRITKLVMSAIQSPNDTLVLDKETKTYYNELRKFMFARVYHHPKKQEEENKAKQIVEHLFHHFHQHPEKLPKDYQIILEKEGIERGVADYISGMTDDFATNKFQEIYLPKAVVF